MYMIIFDYIFYQLQNFYKYFEPKDDTHKGSAVIILGTCVALNIITFVFIANFFFSEIKINKTFVLLIYFIVLFGIWYRYYKCIDIINLSVKFNKYNMAVLMFLDIITIVYVIGSIFGVFLSAIYLRPVSS